MNELEILWRVVKRRKPQMDHIARDARKGHISSNRQWRFEGFMRHAACGMQILWQMAHATNGGCTCQRGKMQRNSEFWHAASGMPAPCFWSRPCSCENMARNKAATISSSPRSGSRHHHGRLVVAKRWPSCHRRDAKRRQRPSRRREAATATTSPPRRLCRRREATTARPRPFRRREAATVTIMTPSSSRSDDHPAVVAK